jgi:hypothetical protein
MKTRARVLGVIERYTSISMQQSAVPELPLCTRFEPLLTDDQDPGSMRAVTVDTLKLNALEVKPHILRPLINLLLSVRLEQLPRSVGHKGFAPSDDWARRLRHAIQPW